MVRAISIPNFRMIGRIVPEKQGGVKFTPPGFRRCQETPDLIRVNRLASIKFVFGVKYSNLLDLIFTITVMKKNDHLNS